MEAVVTSSWSSGVPEDNFYSVEASAGQTNVGRFTKIMDDVQQKLAVNEQSVKGSACDECGYVYFNSIRAENSPGTSPKDAKVSEIRDCLRSSSLTSMLRGPLPVITVSSSSADKLHSTTDVPRREMYKSRSLSTRARQLGDHSAKFGGSQSQPRTTDAESKEVKCRVVDRNYYHKLNFPNRRGSWRADDKRTSRRRDSLKSTLSDQTFCNLVHNYLEQTSAHALPRVARSRSWVRSVIWLVVFAFFVLYFVYQFTTLLRTFYSFPVGVTITIEPRSVPAPI